MSQCIQRFSFFGEFFTWLPAASSFDIDAQLEWLIQLDLGIKLPKKLKYVTDFVLTDILQKIFYTLFLVFDMRRLTLKAKHSYPT